MEAPPHEEEATQCVVLDNLGYRGAEGFRLLSEEARHE